MTGPRPRLPPTRPAPAPERRPGLRQNLGQFSLLLLVNAFVGAMVGMERSVLPLLGEREFGLASRTSILAFLFTFGVVKALANAAAGRAADRWGRRQVLLVGWVAALPIPFFILLAPTWGWIVAANVLLGLNQGLCWSAAIVMKVDLVGPRQRGLAIGLNECTGYLAVSVAALLSGYFAARHGLRLPPFWIGVVASLGGLVASGFARETREQTTRGSAATGSPGPRPTPSPTPGPPSLHGIFRRVSWTDPSLRAVSQAGLVNNLNDGLSWGLLPLYFASKGATLEQTGALAAIYPAVWALGQLVTGYLSDRLGRKRPMVGGMVLQALALVALASTGGFASWMACMIALGLGTALVYPAFLGAVADHSEPGWRASAIGIYRWWRDLGYALGALVAGGTADRFGIPVSIVLVGALTAASGLVVAASYSEHHGSRP